MDDSAQLAGFKRYPIHRTFQQIKYEKSDMSTKITPLKEGASFKARIAVHNLKAVELGALLSAMSFHDTKGCFHSIGMAKPLGYGKVALTIDDINGFVHDKAYYLEKFESAINEEVFGGEIKWHQSEQIANLLSMASEQNNKKGSNAELKYMPLKEFASNKKKSDSLNFLDRYIKLDGIVTKTAVPLSTQESIKAYQADVSVFKELQARKEQEAKEQHEYNEAISSNDINKMSSFVAKYPNSKYKQKLLEHIDNLKAKEEQDKFAKINAEANKAWENIHNPKYKAKLKGALESFIKKWENPKNSKSSPEVETLVKQAKKELESI